MKKNIITLLIATTLLTACGERVKVPPAHVGKVLTKSGYQEGFVNPSQFRLEACMAYCDKLVLLKASDGSVTESMELFMPKDQLNMTFAISATVRIERNEKTINDIFDRVPAEQFNNDEGDNVSIITLNRVYEIYAQQKLKSIARSLLASYSINDIASNRSMVENELIAKLQTMFEGTPLRLVQVSLSDVQFPEIITKAKIASKEREVAIEQAKNEKLVSMVKAEAELELAKKDRLVRLERARTIKEENELTAASVSDKYLEYKKLEVMEEIAKSGKAIYMPMETKLLLMGKDK
jgi:hypothetical protein